MIWQCNGKFKDKKTESGSSKSRKCSTPHLKEETVKDAFVIAFSEYFVRKDTILSDFSGIADDLQNTTDIDTRIAKDRAELDVITKAIENCIRLNAHAEISEDDYRQKYDSLYARYNKVSGHLNRLESAKAEDISTAIALQKTINTLRDCSERPYCFSSSLWNACVEKVIVHDGCILEFHMFGGVVVSVGV